MGSVNCVDDRSLHVYLSPCLTLLQYFSLFSPSTIHFDIYLANDPAPGVRCVAP